MKVRGRRRCVECDTRWSYFETGSPVCPACGSLRSVATDDNPALHTDGPSPLDMTPVRSMLDDEPIGNVAEAAGALAREYVRSRGFIAGGELRELDGTFVAAAELSYVAEHLRRTLSVDEPTEAYFLALLSDAESGERPEEVPDALAWARGLAAAAVTEAYYRDLGQWLDEHPHPEVRPVIDLLRSHEKRVSALDGAVPQSEADAFVTAVDELGTYLRRGDESALARAEDRLSRLG